MLPRPGDGLFGCYDLYFGHQLSPQHRRCFGRKDRLLWGVSFVSGAVGGSGGRTTIYVGCGLSIGSCRLTGPVKVGRVEVILSSDSDQREQGIAPRIRERRAHALRGGIIADWADRPFR